MDNVIAIQTAINGLEATGAGALQINYVKALITKAVEQQHAHCDSQGRMYPHSTASRLASSAAQHATDRTVANVNNGPSPGQQQRLGPTYSSKEPHPKCQMVAANGAPIDACTHIANDKAWRARQPHDLQHTVNRNRANQGGRNNPLRELGASLSRVVPQCFGPMVRGERYPNPFRTPKEIKKYEPTLDPVVWIDSYLMAMGIADHTDMLTARYLPLMMEGSTRH
jgi:hypothetical protein